MSDGTGGATGHDPRSVADILASIDASVATLPAEIKAAREDVREAKENFRKERRNRRWSNLIGLVLIVGLLGLGLHVEQVRRDGQREGRCAIRKAVISIGTSAHASPEDLDRIILNLDKDISTNGCDPVAICKDGTPSRSTGPGTCSHHGGVRIIVHPTTTKPGG